jgi:hypothetical protein
MTQSDIPITPSTSVPDVDISSATAFLVQRFGREVTDG